MDFEFDKEIDVLLRQTARSGDVVSNNAATHLDADEISSFAENALPEKIRQQYTLHLADCDKCRKNLSSLILLNADESSEIVHTEEKPFVAAAAAIPWYRKLFAFPNLAYTMGALVLVFSGIAAYTVLQSTSSFENAEVSQTTYEKQLNGKGMSSDGDQSASEPYSSNSSSSAMSANTMTSNTSAMNSTSSSAANAPSVFSTPILNANSNAPMSSADEADKDSLARPKPISPAKTPVDLAKTEDSVTAGPPPAPPAAAMKENEFSMDNEALRQAQTQNSIAQNQTDIMPDSRNAKRAPMPTQQAENKDRKLGALRDDAAEKSKTLATTNVGGKTFKRENNVWYDTAYRGQATVNVTRGTKEYKKLDSGLRGIAENLGGTVVVVWKQKTYRIQ